MSETKKCPFCAEEILLEAVKCKHCGEFLNKSEDKEPKTNNLENNNVSEGYQPLKNNKIVELVEVDKNYSERFGYTTSKELLRIIDPQNNFKEEMVLAAKTELDNREFLLNFIGINDLHAVHELNFEILKNIRLSDDNELLKICSKNFKNYTPLELEFLKREIKYRNLQGTNVKCKYCGGEIPFYALKCQHCGEFIEKKETPAGIIIAAIATFLTAVTWFIIAFIQAGLSKLQPNSYHKIISIGNIIASLVFVVIGVGILKRKYWAQNWGLLLSTLDLIWFIYRFVKVDDNVLNFFMILISLTVAILLFINRKFFD